MKASAIVINTVLFLLYTITNTIKTFTIYENLFYYISLSLICYITEVCDILRSNMNENNHIKTFEKNILLPLFIIPTTGIILLLFINTLCKSVMHNLFSSDSIFTSYAVISYIVGTVISDNNEKRYLSMLLPIVLTYLPLETIILHLLVMYLIRLLHSNGTRS